MEDKTPEQQAEDYAFQIPYDGTKMFVDPIKYDAFFAGYKAGYEVLRVKNDDLLAKVSELEQRLETSYKGFDQLEALKHSINLDREALRAKVSEQEKEIDILQVQQEQQVVDILRFFEQREQLAAILHEILKQSASSAFISFDEETQRKAEEILTSIKEKDDIPDLLAKVLELQKENEQLKKLLDNCTHNSRL